MKKEQQLNDNIEITKFIFYSEAKLIPSIIKYSIFTIIMTIFGFDLLKSNTLVGIFIITVCFMMVFSVLLQIKFLYLCKRGTPALILSDKGILYATFIKEFISWNHFTRAYLWKFSFNSRIWTNPSLDISYRYFDNYKENPLLRSKLILNYKNGSTTIRINAQFLDKNAEDILDLINKFMDRIHTAETEANPSGLPGPQ